MGSLNAGDVVWVIETTPLDADNPYVGPAVIIRRPYATPTAPYYHLLYLCEERLAPGYDIMEDRELHPAMRTCYGVVPKLR